jgi:hypothetical protein
VRTSVPTHLIYYCFRKIEPRRIRWAGYVAGMGENNSYKILVEEIEGRYHLEEINEDKGIILKIVLKK